MIEKGRGFDVALRFRRVALCSAVAAWLCLSGTYASPWAEVGDARLRSDIDILAAAGVVDGITMQWPLPWAPILERLREPDSLNGQPQYVRSAAARVREQALREGRAGAPRSSVTIDVGNSPDVVRGFDALGRQSVQAEASFEYLTDTTAVHVALGVRGANGAEKSGLLLDGTYIAQRVGHAAVYAGYLTHWWGPGWISALSLSNNARPMPQIGVARIDTAPSSSPWLSWLGPWRAEFFVGLLDGPRISRHTIYTGFRFGFSPLPGLEIGLARTTEICGSGHPCRVADYFNLLNDPNHVNDTNDQGNIDLRYSQSLPGWAYDIYAQVMNEDSSPFIHSGTSHLAGASVWLPVSDYMMRLTVEYTNSIATRDIWGSGTLHGVAYSNSGYLDGMRYRGRTLGFSLDSDSQLFSMQANIADDVGRSFTLTYHRANVSNPLNHAGNVVTTAPVSFSLVQGRFSLPLWVRGRCSRFDLEARYETDQPRPAKGPLATIEVSLTVGL